MVYYPISALMLAGIRDILNISTPYDLLGSKRLLGNGSNYGVHFEYSELPSPDGLTQAFIIGEMFIGNAFACFVLGYLFLWQWLYQIAEECCCGCRKEQ